MTDKFDATAEAAFVRNVLAGQKDCMRTLVERLTCVRRILAARNRTMGLPLNGDELDDVVQSTTLTVLRRLHDFRPVAPLESWVHGICVIELIEAVRGKLRRAQRVRALEGEPAASARPLAEVISDTLEVEAALLRLTGIEAQVVSLKHFDGLTFEEMHTRLGISANTLKSHYYRGLAKLRNKTAAGEQSHG